MAGPIVHYQISQMLKIKLLDLRLLAFNTEAEYSALLLGALGPDIGLFQGGRLIISNLAHYHLTGTLAQNIFKRAKDSITKAFAIGWISHYFADILIHPLVNRGVGELLYNDDSIEVDYVSSPADHLRVELGLDGFLYFKNNLPRIQFRLPSEELLNKDFLPRAFQDTYLVEFSIYDFERSFKSSQIYFTILSHIAITHGSRFTKANLPKWCYPVYLKYYIPARFLSAIFGRKFQHYGLGTVVCPNEWLVCEVEKQMQNVVDKTLEYLENENNSLSNLNLDNGEVLDLEAELPNYIKVALMEFDELLKSR